MSKLQPVKHGRDHRPPGFNGADDPGGVDHIPHRRLPVAVIDGLGAEITTGIKGEYFIDFPCEIIGWTLLADQPGDIQIDIWKTPLGSFPPDVGDTITGGSPPVLSAAQSADGGVSGWTTTVDYGDTFIFNVDSVSTVTRVSVFLSVKA